MFMFPAPDHDTIEFLVAEQYLAETNMENEAAIQAAMSRVWLAIIRSQSS